MKILAAALAFLILAAALGPPAQASLRFRSAAPAQRRPGDCCLSYNSSILLCKHMTDYIPRVKRCSLPAIIFKTKNGSEFCANPHITHVQHCAEDLETARRAAEVAVLEKPEY